MPWQQDMQVLGQELQSDQPSIGKLAGIVGLPTIWLHALKEGMGLCREFVICIISEWFLEAANHTCGEYDKGCNEMELAGLTPEPSHKASFSVPIPACRMFDGECTQQVVCTQYRLAHELLWWAMHARVSEHESMCGWRIVDTKANHLTSRSKPVVLMFPTGPASCSCALVQHQTSRPESSYLPGRESHVVHLLQVQILAPTPEYIKVT